MVAVFDPPKVRSSVLPMGMPSAAASETVAAPISSGLSLYSLVRRTRMRAPAALMRITWRTVWFSKVFALAGGGVGDAPHAPIQFPACGADPPIVSHADASIASEAR